MAARKSRAQRIAEHAKAATSTLPWSVTDGVQHPVGSTFGIKDADGNWVAKLHPLNGDVHGRAQAEANAQAMVAGTEAVELVREFFDWFDQAFFVIYDPNGIDDGAKDLARRAAELIAKVDAP